MARRSARSSFAPDAFVFPGGVVDPQDRTAQAKERTAGVERQRLAEMFRAVVPAELPCEVPNVSPEDRAPLLIAALRELFEEAGVLIARDANGAPIDARAEHAALNEARERVRTGALPFADLLAAEDWYADASQLSLFSHWITPPTEPRRYNTHFFFAQAPPGQAADADAYEVHDGVWIEPRRALRDFGDGRFHLVYPTIKHLELFTGITSMEQAQHVARSKPVLTIMPGMAPDEGFVMPPALEGVW